MRIEKLEKGNNWKDGREAVLIILDEDTEKTEKRRVARIIQSHFGDYCGNNTYYVDNSDPRKRYGDKIIQALENI